MLDQFSEFLARIEREEDERLREDAALLESRLENGAARLRQGIASLVLQTRIALICIVTGGVAMLVTLSHSAVGAMGSGYFLRFGILLIGVGLHRILRR